ncbi:MAG: SRPBCC family protein [Cyanobacteria bacterium P01_F01_bin.33]
MLMTSGLVVAVYFATNKCTLTNLHTERLTDTHDIEVPPHVPLRAWTSIRLDATPDEVFTFLVDEEMLPEWMPDLTHVSYDHDRATSPGALGLGSQRTLMFGEHAELENIIQLEPPRILIYQILSGVPVRNHQSILVVKEHKRSGTTLTWHQHFNIKRSSPYGLLMPYIVRRFLNEANSNLIEALGGESIAGCQR